MRCSVYMAISLDGFYAPTNGELDWLNDLDTSHPMEDDLGFSAFMESIDVLLMGRRTFDQVHGMGVWPYGPKPVRVLTHRGLPVDLPENSDIKSMAGSPKDVAEQLHALGFSHIYVDGGEPVKAFLDDGLVDQLILTQVPVLLGEGRSFFNAYPNWDSYSIECTASLPSGYQQFRIFR